MRIFAPALAASLLFALPIFAQIQDIVPSKRLVLSADLDLPGGDISQMFDTTLDACIRACLADNSCTDLTFNSRNNSCFGKANPGEGGAYQGAISGHVLATSPDVLAQAQAREGELSGFLPTSYLEDAKSQARELGQTHYTNGFTAEEHGIAKAEAEARGDSIAAMRFAGAVVNLTDRPEDWLEYARLSKLAYESDTDRNRNLLERAAYAAGNGYLRAGDGAPLRHNLLVSLGDSLEILGNGRGKVQALRLAQELVPRDDTDLALTDAIGKYGFRITDHVVEVEGPRPRICANFSENLQQQGVDYESFVQLPEPGLSVRLNGNQSLCVEGVSHGMRYALTFREGLPAADGQSLAKSVAITSYIRDREPMVRFPGRSYVLPRGNSPAIPVTSTNTDKLDLVVYRVTDRNLMRSFQAEYFNSSMSEWNEERFGKEFGDIIWRGQASVGLDVNKDVTTRLPMDAALQDQAPGIYALKASVPGVDPYEIESAWQWFIVTDLGLTTMSGVDGLNVFVRSLGTAEARAGVTLELISNTNEVLASITTDNLGHGRFDPGLTRGTGGQAPALVIAREGSEEFAFLSLTDPEFDLSDRGVEGREAAPAIDVFLTTDRGAYRVGETVNATALARDGTAEAVPGLPLTALLKRPDGVEYSRNMVNDSGAGGHVFALPIGASAPRGVWRLEILADLEAPPLTSKTFLVEDFLPERIDFTLALASDQLRLGDTPDLRVEARYLFGAPGADLSIEGDVLLRATNEVAGFAGYRFGPHDQPFDAVRDSFDGATTDSAGHAEIAIALPLADGPEADLPLQPIEAHFTLRIAEGSGRPVERQLTQALMPAAAMIGVKPLFEDVVGEGSDAAFSVVALGLDSKPTAMTANWELTRIETHYQWYQSYGSWNWEPVVTRNPVAEGQVALGNAPSQIDIPVKWGEYELKLSQQGGTAITSTTFYAGWYAPADVTTTPDTLELSLDKPAYLPGETAQLRLVPRAAGTALITVLSNRLISMQAVEVTEGENLISLPVTDEWGAGVYVTASVLRPMDLAASRNPARALGLAHAAVDPGARKLNVTIDTAPEAAPRGPLQVAVKVDGLQTGDTAWATIAAVDEGILNLTAFKSPDPSTHYFGQRKLGVGIRDVYGRLIDGLNGAEGQIRSGGDAGAGARLQAPPPTEELVAYFSGPVQVVDGVATAQFDLPSFNGSVKVMAVVWSGTSVGQADATVLVRDPVVVTASLPRFMAPGDESRMLLEIVHATGPAGRMSLDATAKGISLGAIPSGFELSDQGKAVFAVPVTANAEGIHQIEIALTTPDGKVLRKTLTLPVQANDPEVARTSRLTLAKGQTLTLDDSLFIGLSPGSAKATMAIGPLGQMDAPGLLAALDRYPYGCTEQITSKALPLLYFDEVAQAMQLPGADNLRLRIDQAIAAVLTNQGADGTFGLWGAGNSGSTELWLDAYVTDFLSRAKARGFGVPDQAFRQALDNLRNQVNYAPDFNDQVNGGGEALAYALMVLAREGAAAIGDLRYYADVKGQDFRTALAQAQLGAALASYGDQPRADAMFRLAGQRVEPLARPEEAQLRRVDFGTNYRDAAAILTLAVESGSDAVNREALLTQLTRQPSAMSTQEQSWALMATHALIDRPQPEGIMIDGQAPSGPLVKAVQAGQAPVTITNSGADTQLTLTSFGIPTEPEPAGGNGYAITRSYYTLDGAPTDLSTLKTGDRLVTVLQVETFGSHEGRLMVVDPLPAGFEIDNPNLISSGDTTALSGLNLPDLEVAHSEFRQDRFMTALDRRTADTFRLAYIVRAISPGSFHHPAASVEDMYRPTLRARGETGRITIAE